MHRIVRIFGAAALAAGVALAAGCMPVASTGGTARTPPDTEWRLESMPGVASVEGTRGAPTLRIDPAAARVSGDGGVNRYSAKAAIDGASLRVGDAIATRMAGSPDAMALESAFLGRLQRVAAWRLDGDRLVLLDAGGAALMVLRPADGTSR